MSNANPIPAKMDGPLPSEMAGAPAQRATLGITKTGRDLRPLHQTAKGMRSNANNQSGSANVQPPGKSVSLTFLPLAFFF